MYYKTNFCIMKFYLTIIQAFFILNFSFSQDTIYKYYNQDWKVVKQAESYFSRKIFKNKEGVWEANDFFKSGKIQMIGYFTSKKTKKRNGHFIYFYENGNISSEGDYLNNLKNGFWKYYSENGVIHKEGKFINGKKTGNGNGI